MDSVTIDGVTYTKASVLAKKYRYTNDYIGQLCRSKKVDSHLVGRTWYVYQPSLDSHKETRYSEIRSDDIKVKRDLETKFSRLNIESPVKKSVVKSISESKVKNFQNHVYWRNGSYEADDSELIPVPQRTVGNEISTLPISLVGAALVRVASRSRNVTLTTEPMPAIALGGTLKVQDFTPDLSTIEDNNVEEPSYIDVFQNSAHAAPVLHGSAELHTRHLEVAHSKEIKSALTIRHPNPEQSRKPSDFRSGMKADLKKSLHIPQVVTLKHADGSGTPPTGHGVLFHLVVTPLVVIVLSLVTGLILSVESVTNISPADQQVASLRFDISVWERILPW
jgi:hypothetical protein